MYLIIIDGGGTKTELALADKDGNVKAYEYQSTSKMYDPTTTTQAISGDHKTKVTHIIPVSGDQSTGTGSWVDGKTPTSDEYIIGLEIRPYGVVPETAVFKAYTLPGGTYLNTQFQVYIHTDAYVIG